MIIGLMSDTHDNIPALRKALKILMNHDINTVIHCGDFVSPFILKEISSFPGKFIGVFGNNDGDKYLLLKIAEKNNIEIFTPPHVMELYGKRILVLHGFGPKDFTRKIVYELAESKNYDLIFYGHTHEREVKQIHGTLVVNPGEILGYLSGESTLAIVNLEKPCAKIVKI